MHSKYVIHIPHAGVSIPQKYVGDYFLSAEELQRNIEQYADYKADELFKALTDKHKSVVSPYSRLFMDPERFFEDDAEDMQVKYGLGWFYENAILEKKPLRSTENKQNIAEYYHKHHEKLTTLVQEKVKTLGECTIIDCHTFSNERYWFHDKDIELPDICIGFEEFHKDEGLVRSILKIFKGYSVAINVPYAGSLVPTQFYKKDNRVKSVMIEINKKLYLEPDNITLLDSFVLLQTELKKLL